MNTRDRPTHGPAERLIYSAVNYWVALGVDVAAAAGFLIAGVHFFRGSLMAGLSAVVGGALLWTAAEYAGHRWLLHGPRSTVQRAHARHHADGAALISAPAFLGVAVAGAAWVLLAWASSGGFAGLVVSGVYGGYNYYVLLHHVQHRHRALFVRVWGLAHLEQAHRAHHRRHVVNFGVSTTLWDRLLGTYESPAGADAIRSRPRASLARRGHLHAR